MGKDTNIYKWSRQVTFLHQKAGPQYRFSKLYDKTSEGAYFFFFLLLSCSHLFETFDFIPLVLLKTMTMSYKNLLMKQHFMLVTTKDI